MKLDKKYFIVVFVIVILILLNQKPSIEEQLVGTWINTNGELLIFNDDHSGETDFSYFNWSTDEKNLYLDIDKDNDIDDLMPIVSDELNYLEFRSTFDPNGIYYKLKN